MTQTKLINLWAGPGAGKSTMAAGLFHEMKSAGASAEYVQEYAKELTWNKDWDLLNNQLLVSGEQTRRVKQLIGKVDYIVTDSPIMLGQFYSDAPYQKEAIHWLYYSTIYPFVDTFDVFVKRIKPFVKEGRNQSLEQAKELGGEITDHLYDTLGEDFTWVTGDKEGLSTLISRIEEEYGVFNI